MRIVTVTSDNFIRNTELLIESLRVWHPDYPVTVYALETRWTPEHTRRLSDLPGVNVRPLKEVDITSRDGKPGQAIRLVWKLDVFLDQHEPFLFVDSDMLVLQPLEPVLRRFRRDGWFAVHEGTPMAFYLQGPLARITGLADLPTTPGSFNTGLVGADPARHRPIFELAKHWADELKTIPADSTDTWSGDQGLLNLACWKVHGRLPDSAPVHWNSAPHVDGRIDPGCAVLHIAGHYVHVHRPDKAVVQQRFWDQWPRGLRIVHLLDTDFWQDSLPHPWQFANRANQPRYRAKLRRMRRDSLALLDTPNLLIRNEAEAFLLDARVLAAVDRWWREHAPAFAKLPHLDTCQMTASGRYIPAGPRRRRRWLSDLRSWLPV